LCTRRGAENIFGPYSPSDLAAVSVPGDRQRDLDARRDVTLPPAPRHRIALTLEATVAGVGRVATDIQSRDALASAVHDVIDERPVAATHVDGFEDRDVHRVLDVAARIAWRQLDVGDHRIERIFRIHLTVCCAVKLLVLSNIAE